VHQGSKPVAEATELLVDLATGATRIDRAEPIDQLDFRRRELHDPAVTPDDGVGSDRGLSGLESIGGETGDAATRLFRDLDQDLGMTAGAQE
jgi:hypothetical protein